MNEAGKKSPAGRYAKRAWQSDVIVDLIKHYGFPYIALNPGASYRGLHDSLVNYGGNDPPLLLCQHEKIAVQIAHGYAKATGKPMVAIVHDVVGMLHATMGIYYAYLDRCPVFVIGATGPMDESRRRPFIDWIHTANVNGEQLRHYVKWDYQPASIEGVPDSFARAYAAMMTEPQGPIYMCYDAWLQEQPLERDVVLPQPSHNKVPAPMAADPAALAAVVERLLAANHPVLMAEYVARGASGFDVQERSGGGGRGCICGTRFGARTASSTPIGAWCARCGVAARWCRKRSRSWASSTPMAARNSRATA